MIKKIFRAIKNLQKSDKPKSEAPKVEVIELKVGDEVFVNWFSPKTCTVLSPPFIAKDSLYPLTGESEERILVLDESGKEHYPPTYLVTKIERGDSREVQKTT